MKVIFVTREGYNLAGARVRCYNFARELVEQGCEAEVFSFPEQFSAPCGEKELQMSLRSKLCCNLEAFKRLINKSRDTIFYLQRFNYHCLAPLAVSWLKRNKVVFDCDDWNIREDPVYYLGLFPSSKMEYVTRKLAKSSSGCVVASVFLRDYLSRFNKKIDYLPTGVDTSKFSPKVKPDNGKIIFSWTGTVYHPEMKENLEFALSCFRELADKYSNIFFSLVGEGGYYERIREGSKNLPHSARINFNSWIHPDSVPGYLAQVDIGLLPLIQDSSFNKAKSPTKLFEYMAMGKPSVCSKIGEAAILIKNNENGLLAADRGEFIAAMDALIREPGLRQKLGDSACALVEREYSLKVLGRKLYQVLKTI